MYAPNHVTLSTSCVTNILGPTPQLPSPGFLCGFYALSCKRIWCCSEILSQSPLPTDSFLAKIHAQFSSHAKNICLNYITSPSSFRIVFTLSLAKVIFLIRLFRGRRVHRFQILSPIHTVALATSLVKRKSKQQTRRTSTIKKIQQNASIIILHNIWKHRPHFSLLTRIPLLIPKATSSILAKPKQQDHSTHENKQQYWPTLS